MADLEGAAGESLTALRDLAAQVDGARQKLDGLEQRLSETASRVSAEWSRLAEQAEKVLAAVQEQQSRLCNEGDEAGQAVAAAAEAVSAARAEAEGALGDSAAQTTGFASLDGLDFHRSADVMLVVVIGGAGWLWGGVVGAVLFKLLHDVLSAWTPQYWLFWLGLFLVVLVMVGRDRFFKPWTWFKK